jgi:hypothetical protein
MIFQDSYSSPKPKTENMELLTKIKILGGLLVISQFCLACESNNNKTTSSTTPITNQSPILKPETPKPVFVSAEYKMFRAAGASPEKAQALKDACTADKTCPKTLKIAKAVVKGEVSLGLVSKPDQPCTEAEFKQEEKSEGSGDGCYYKSAEAKKAMREAEAANQAQENKPSAVESWKDAAVLAESQPDNKDLADNAEKARLEAIVENGKRYGLSKAYVLCSASIRADENGMAIEECDADGNKHPLN